MYFIQTLRDLIRSLNLNGLRFSYKHGVDQGGLAARSGTEFT